MSKKAVKPKKAKKVFIDAQNVFAKLKREKGIKITGVSFAEEFGISSVTLTDWGKEAPKSVRVIFEFLEKYDIDFKDFVKSC